MFVLFSMAAAAGSLLAEEESGTLERLLNSQVRLELLLISKWIFFAAAGIIQLVIMFVWAALVFGLNLWTFNNLTGFLVMTFATAAAASAFGIILAALCKTRAQMQGISTVVILIMSALGGSMVPRYLMPSFMVKVSRFTINGWALDGYLKVFWYNDPDTTLLRSLVVLWPQLLTLACMTWVFLAVGVRLSRRWESI
jgi:ABC-2 type transport system permease protein